MKPHPNVVNVRFAHIMGFCSENEECLCFEDFVTGADLASLVLEGRGKLYNGTAEEVKTSAAGCPPRNKLLKGRVVWRTMPAMVAPF